MIILLEKEKSLYPNIVKYCEETILINEGNDAENRRKRVKDLASQEMQTLLRKRRIKDFSGIKLKVSIDKDHKYLCKLVNKMIETDLSAKQKTKDLLQLEELEREIEKNLRDIREKKEVELARIRKDLDLKAKNCPYFTAPRL